MGCDGCLALDATGNEISTHTSRVGCDNAFAQFVVSAGKFLLTHPVWDVTSVHSTKNVARLFLLTHPVWDVTMHMFCLQMEHKFLLTHPVWDVTFSACFLLLLPYISTHTSRVGCDFCGCIICWWRCISTHTSRVGCDYSCENIGMQAINFYSHIPCGMWRPYVLYCVVPRWISTHTSRVGCDHRQNYM